MNVLIVSNSQGTAAGLPDDFLYKSYPHLLAAEFPNVNFIFWNMSNLSVETVDGLFREIVLQHSPALVLFQLGIIETGFRILPKYMKNLFSVLPFGRSITGLIHKNQKHWRKLLSSFGIIFVETNKNAFEVHLKNIIDKARENKIGVSFIEIPLLSQQCNEEWLFKNNITIDEYNNIITSVCIENGVDVIKPFLNCPDNTRNSLFLNDSVHFTIDGHRLVAHNITEYLTKYLNHKI